MFPCKPGQKTPATPHGFRDATTDPSGRSPPGSPATRGWNLAIATGAPGPDVLDVDEHGPAGNGYAAFAKLTKAGLMDGAAAYVRTPSGGLHAYFRGSGQRNGHLPAHHLDFRSRGGYILAPPSWVDGKPYQLIRTVDADGDTGLGHRHRPCWNPSGRPPGPSRTPTPAADLSHLARWVAAQAEGNRNAGLFWAANRALEADPAADLSPLAAAARQAGLGEREITRTLDSARKTGQTRPPAPDYQAEAGDKV